MVATAVYAYLLPDGVAPEQNNGPIVPITTTTITNTDGRGACSEAARRLLGSGEGESCDELKHCAFGFTLSNTRCALSGVALRCALVDDVRPDQGANRLTDARDMAQRSGKLLQIYN